LTVIALTVSTSTFAQDTEKTSQDPAPKSCCKAQKDKEGCCAAKQEKCDKEKAACCTKKDDAAGGETKSCGKK